MDRHETRHIIGNITVIVDIPAVVEDCKIIPVTRAFVNVSDSSKGEFVSIKTALSSLLYFSFLNEKYPHSCGQITNYLGVILNEIKKVVNGYARSYQYGERTSRH